MKKTEYVYLPWQLASPFHPSLRHQFLPPQSQSQSNQTQMHQSRNRSPRTDVEYI